jgi:FeS assembly SUF system regulator
MRLSNLTDYAIVMLSAAARGGQQSLSASMLAEETGVPLPTAQKLMGRLAAAGLLTSSRGIGGGFRLARDSAQISMADIIEAVEGPIAMTACVEEGRHDCGLETACKVKPHWSAVNSAVKGALGGVSLASLSSPPPFVPSAVDGSAVEGRV